MTPLQDQSSKVQCYNCGHEVPPLRIQPKGTEVTFCSDRCEHEFTIEVTKSAIRATYSTTYRGLK